MKAPSVLFVADPLSGFNPEAETTSFLMLEAQRRGFDLFHVEPSDLSLTDKGLEGRLTPLQIKRQRKRFQITPGKTTLKKLKTLSAIFLRKDPPFDLSYLYHLQLCDTLRSSTQLINNPASVIRYNEKLLPLHFSKLSPATAVSNKNDVILSFLQKQKKAVLKPLNLSGGREIVQISANDPSAASIVSMLTHEEKRTIMAQTFLKEATRGDKRILIFDDMVLGAFLRVPSKKDFRGNLHSGASLKPIKLTSRDKDILDQVMPFLQSQGLRFVGLDVIGDFVTEINVTSPMGIHEINELSGRKVESMIFDRLGQTP